MKKYLAALAFCLGTAALTFTMRGSVPEPWLGQTLAVLIILSGYAAGAIPFGVLIAGTFCGIDPRSAGSGNIGATNVSRLCGFKYGVMALVCDILKGLLPALLAGRAPLIFYGNAPLNPVWLCSLTGFAAILGHRYSPFIGFKGGKAVATTIGVFIALAFRPLLVAAVLCILVIWRSGFVSLGAMVLVSSMPFLLVIFGRMDLLPLSLAVAALVIYAHKGNIQRLLRGEEKSWMKSKNPPGDKPTQP